MLQCKLILSLNIVSIKFELIKKLDNMTEIVPIVTHDFLSIILYSQSNFLENGNSFTDFHFKNANNTLDDVKK